MKIAIIDSGIHSGHPHVGEIAGALEITLTGEGRGSRRRPRRSLACCREHDMDIVNFSLGTENSGHRQALIEAIGDLLIVSTASALPRVIGVAPDPDCPRDNFRYHDGMLYASAYPRPIPAVANMTELAARALRECTA